MNRRNAKTITISLALMLLMCVATALLSFSLADETAPAGSAGSGSSSTTSTVKTNIDYIIDNSYETPVEGERDISQFYIVEIGSSATNYYSELYQMIVGSRTERVDNSGTITEVTVDYNDLVGGAATTGVSNFVKNVINGWSTQGKTMVRNKINYTYYSSRSITNDNGEDIAKVLDKADLIYISNNPDDPYTAANDIASSYVKNALQKAITTNQTPFIIDSPTKTMNGDGGDSTKTFAGFVKNVLLKEGRSRNAFANDTQALNADSIESVRAYFGRTGSDSLWLPIYGNNHSANWTSGSTANILILTGNSDVESFALDSASSTETRIVFKSGTKTVVVEGEGGAVKTDAAGRINIVENNTDGYVYYYTDTAGLHILSRPNSSFAVSNKVLAAAEDTYAVYTRDDDTAVFTDETNTAAGRVKLETDVNGAIVRDDQNGYVNIIDQPEGYTVTWYYDFYQHDEDGKVIYRTHIMEDAEGNYVKNEETGGFQYEYDLDADGHQIPLPEPQKDAAGNVIKEELKDADGNTVYEYDRDADGKLQKDADGNPLYKAKTDENGNIVYEPELDEEGNVVTDENGDVVYKKDGDGNPIPEKVPVLVDVPKTEVNAEDYDDAHFHLVYVASDGTRGEYSRLSAELAGDQVTFTNGTNKIVLQATDGVIDRTEEGDVIVIDKPGTGVVTVEAIRDSKGVEKLQVVLRAPDYTVDPVTGEITYHIATSMKNTFYDYGYSSSQVRPDSVHFETGSVNDDGTINCRGSLESYDMIIMEYSLKDLLLESGEYNALYNLVYSLQHFMYDSRLGIGGSSGQGQYVTSDAATYQAIMNEAATPTEVAKYKWVLVTGKSEMKLYREAESKSGVKPIADIINNGSYRGSGASNDASKKYTVLEIQPCYPIDLKLAKVIGSRNDLRSQSRDPKRGGNNNYDDTSLFYYLDYDNIANHTSDEIGFAKDDGTIVSLTDMETTDDNTTGISTLKDNISATDSALIKPGAVIIDYYAWELSEAKVAKLVGKSINEVSVVHMSSTEFSTSRVTLLDNYDAIYIGGNNSAIRDISYLRNMFVGGRNSGNAAIYNMYYHNGGTYTKGSEIGVLTGNDITYDKLIELEDYILAGMPVIFTKTLADAYLGAVTQGSNQTLLDPYSNMYKLITYCMSDTSEGAAAMATVSAKAANNRTRADYFSLLKSSLNGTYDPATDTYEDASVCFGFNEKDQVKAVNDGSFGTTYGGYVTVFGGVETDVYVNGVPKTIVPSRTSVNAFDAGNILQKAAKRPKFALLIPPTIYGEGDPSTEMTGSSFQIKYEIYLEPFASEEDRNAAKGQQAYTINFYVDDNTDTMFGEDEILYTRNFNYDSGGDVATAGRFNVNFSSQFDGAMYWKFEVVTHNRKGSKTYDLKSSTVNLSKVKVKEKNEVNLLQIMPEKASVGSKTEGCTLFFCTECQQAKKILRGNRYTGDGKKYGQPYTTNAQFTDGNFNAMNVALQNPANGDPAYAATTSKKATTYHNQAANKNLGTHVHNFGIVKYDDNLKYTGTATIRNQKAEDANVGNDDWSQNWAYDLLNDYTFDMDIWTTRDFENNVADAMSMINAGITDVDTVIANYDELAQLYFKYYRTMQRIIDGTVDTSSADFNDLMRKLTGATNGDIKATNQSDATHALETAKGGFGVSVNEFNQYLVAQKNLDALLTLAETKVDHVGDTNHDNWLEEIAYEKQMHRYYDFYNLTNAMTGADKYSGWTAQNYTVFAADGTNTTTTTKNASNNFYNEFSGFYQYWRNAKVYERYFYSMYTKYKTYGTMYKDTDGKYYPDYYQFFTCIVMGVDRGYGGDDIKSKDAIRTLQIFIEQEGNMFIFRNTLADKYEVWPNQSNSNTANMTEGLKTLFGQDYNHTAIQYIYGELPTSLSVSYKNQWNGDLAGTKIDTISPNEGLNIKIFFGDSDRVEVTKTNNPGKVHVDWQNSKFFIQSWDGAPNANYYGGGATVSIQGKEVFKLMPDASGPTGSADYEFTVERPIIGQTTIGASDKVIKSYKMSNGSTVSAKESDVYYYSPFLKDGSTITVSGTHRTWATDGALGNDYKELLNMYKCTTAMEKNQAVPYQDLNFGGSGSYLGVTDRASQVNKGVITLYPFKIVAENMHLSKTNPNGFSTDIEDTDLVVYYTLSGGENNGNNIASVVAADPHDGIDNYYLYSYGSVTYCGAGNSNLTGPKRDNNDERKLFINVIVNTARKSVFGPSIAVYDAPATYSSTTQRPNELSDSTLYRMEEVTYNGATVGVRYIYIGEGQGTDYYAVTDNGVTTYYYVDPDSFGKNTNIAQLDNGEYVINLTSTSDIPSFSYLVTVPNNNDEVDEVKIYYDLSRERDGDNWSRFVDDGTDIEIMSAKATDADGKIIDKSILKNQDKPIMYMENQNPGSNPWAGLTHNGDSVIDFSKLQLNLDNKDYFAPYDGQFTYIVIAIKTKKGDTAYQRIMIKLAPKLWDLT